MDKFDSNDFLKIYFDTEFSSLSKDGTLLSIGLVSENGHMFYAEINGLNFKYESDCPGFVLLNYDDVFINEFVKENVLPNFLFNGYEDININHVENNAIFMALKDSFVVIHKKLNEWLKKINPWNGKIQFYSDCCYWDMMHLIDLITYHKTAMELPENISYIPMDLCTILQSIDIDPDCNREKFIRNYYNIHDMSFDKIINSFMNKILNPLQSASNPIKIDDATKLKHNSLYDAFIIKMAFQILNNMI